MAIFYSANRIQFGKPLPPPADGRPPGALFVQGRVPKGYPFCLTWNYETGAVGYHIFRSQSVSHIRPRSMPNLWRGSYGDSMTHFVIGEAVDTVIDDYHLRESTSMFYWVLAQSVSGELHPVENLQVRMADDFARARQHILLTRGRQLSHSAAPSTPPPARSVNDTPRLARHNDGAPEPMVPTVEDDRPFHNPAASSTPRRPSPPSRPQPATPPQATPARQVFFITFTTPGLFQVRPPAEPVDHYLIYVGPQLPPNAQLADAMWDGNLLPGNPMRRYTLPGHVEGWTDKHHPPNQTVYMAVFATLQSGQRIQPEIVIPPTPPAMLAELT